MKITSLYFLFLILLFCNNYSYAKTIIGKAKIVDGDTIHINKNKIRLHGIDAPEIKQTCILESKLWSCGKQSTLELKKLINNKRVICKVNDIDIYRRFVAVCYIGTLNINKWMVKNGWAIAYKYYSIDYINEETLASKNKLGIWKSQFIDPYLHRKQNKK